MSHWRDCHCVICLSWLVRPSCPRPAVLSRHCPLMSSSESSFPSEDWLIISYKYTRILPMVPTSLAQLPSDRHTAQAHYTAYHTRLLRQITTIYNGFQQLFPILSPGQHPRNPFVHRGKLCRKCPTMLHGVRRRRWSRLDLSNLRQRLLHQLRAV